MGISDRKNDHVRIALSGEAVSSRFRGHFDQVRLLHEALPSFSLESIHLETEFASKKLKAPLIVGAMTGGMPGSEVINGNIAEAVQELGLGMGVGSERPAIERPAMAYTFSVVRRKAPDALVLANLGAANLKKMGIKNIRQAVEMVGADALEVHLNMVQELLQPEGEPSFEGVEDALDGISDEIGVPLLVKETGSGISAETAKRLDKRKIYGFDVGGAGGTSFAVIESKRRKDDLGLPFYDWGIPTAISIMEVRSVSGKRLVASGGLRNGVDLAKSLVLGADIGSLAGAVLPFAVKSGESVKVFLDAVERQLKMTMLLTGARDVESLRKVPYLLLGDLLSLAQQRGLYPTSTVSQRG